MHSLLRQEPSLSWVVTYIVFLFWFPQKAQLLPQSEQNTQTYGLIEEYFKWTGIKDAIFIGRLYNFRHII